MFGSSGEHLSFKNASKHGFSFVQIGLFQNEFSKIGLRLLVKDWLGSSCEHFCSSLFVQIGLPLSQNWIYFEIDF